jgi:hypothetical protein
LRWEAPKFGEYKVNWEVCKESCSNMWYVGVLIRNHVGGGDGVTERDQSTCGCLLSYTKVCTGARFFSLPLSLSFHLLPDICLEGPRVNSLEVGSSLQKESIADMWNEEVWVFIQRFHHFTVSSSNAKFNVLL